MTRNLFVFLFVLNCSGVFACLSTYQFKIFPVGHYNGRIFSVDVQIQRTSTNEGNQRYQLQLDSVGEMEEMWIIRSYISSYDHNQKLLSCSVADSAFAVGTHYSDQLKKI